MKDLTRGSVMWNVASMASPAAVTMAFQALYLVVDLYFIAGLGEAALAGAGAAGTAAFGVMALTRSFGVGSLALLAQAAGRKDAAGASRILAQSLLLASSAAALTLLAGYAGGRQYLRLLGADADAAAEGWTYLRSWLPGLAMQFFVATMVSALGGAGIVRRAMIVQSMAVLLNVILAPVLIEGWGTGRPLGIAGAGLSSTISVSASVVALTLCLLREGTYAALRGTSRVPRWKIWKQLLLIGLPAGGELALTFLYTTLVYYWISASGAGVQAGFGIGWRVLQIVLMPAAAISFASASVAGQNAGAGHAVRVRDTLAAAILLCTVVMLALSAVLLWMPGALVELFTDDPLARATAIGFLEWMSLALVPHGIVFACSGVFQGLGRTGPLLAGASARMGVFVPLAIWLTGQTQFVIEDLWHASALATWSQAIVCCLLLRAQFKGLSGGIEPRHGRGLSLTARR